MRQRFRYALTTLFFAKSYDIRKVLSYYYGWGWVVNIDNNSVYYYPFAQENISANI